MKNVKIAVNLRRFSKSIVSGLFLLLFVLAGSAFTLSPGRAVNTAKHTDNAVIEKGMKSLFSEACYNPARPAVTKLNPSAVSFVQRYIRDEGENLEKMKVWGKPYFDMYDEILPRYGVPKELKYLSVIESALIRDITSPAGAAGPWQIMASEARRVGLKVNSAKDERKNFIKSTQAAGQILQELHGLFHDWLLVVAAYNCGEVRVQQAIRKSHSHNYWELQAYLPAETRAHVKRFIGTHYIFEGNGGLTTMTASKILELKDDSGQDNKADEKNMLLEITGKYRAAIIAKNIGMPLDEFARLNPDFDYKTGTGRKYNLRLPEDKIMAFANNKMTILKECLQWNKKV